MAQSGTSNAGTAAAPVFTESRIEALRNHLRALMKAMRVGYTEAATADATQKQRENANLLVAQFTTSLEEVEEEYRRSIVTTDDVVFAANNLLAEMQAYRTVLGERFSQLGTAAPSDGASATAEEGRESSEAASEGATATIN